MVAHGNDLRAEVDDPGSVDALIAAFEEDYRLADVSDRERAILDYAIKLTLHPSKMASDDVGALRDAGLSDDTIHDVAQVVGFFNLYNRLADGLGIQPEPDW